MVFNQQTLKAMSRHKTLAEAKCTEGGGGTGGGLRRSLTGVDLVLYGVGSSVGAGIYVMVGLGATIAGPAISLSFLSCGLACILTSLAYAEFAARIPVAGSAYTYVYVAFGEIFAWCVAWFLILGYGFTASVVARAWADYAGDLLIKVFKAPQLNLPTLWLERLTEWHIFGDDVHYSFSLLSMLIIALNTWILLRGAKDSAVFNNAMTIMNIAVLVLVISAGLASGSIETENLTPFVPHHAPSVLQGAGLVFFAFIGFDMVASLSEEVIAPERNMPIGIVGSLVATTFIYVSVSLAVVGMAPVHLLGENVPIINALVVNAYCTHSEQLMHNATDVCLGGAGAREAIRPALIIVSRIVDTGAIFGLMVCCFTSLMGQPRIFYRMAQDGLWFPVFADVDPVNHVPRFGIIMTGVVTSILACFVPLDALANLISLGTLMVFTFVDAGVILLRVRTQPEVVDPERQRMKSTQQQTMSHHQKANPHHEEARLVTLLLILYTGALTLASVLFTSTSYKYLGALCILVAAGAAFYITVTPNTWAANFSATDSSSHEHHFSCPFVPCLPLVGIACNALMMGSLPMQAWCFCLGWLILGLAFYFVYGIHHSALQHNDRYSERTPLVAMGGISQPVPTYC